MWSLGISLIELALGRFPFSDSDDDSDLSDFEGTLSPSRPLPPKRTPIEKDKKKKDRSTEKSDKSKKRKRNSNAENEESPATKHPRTDIKEEGSPDSEEHLEDRKEVELPSSGDVPLQDADAANILEVLELCVVSTFPIHSMLILPQG